MKTHLENLDFLQETLHSDQEAKKIRLISKELQAQQCKFVKIPEVDFWLAELSAVADRRKFLVLNGPSRLGKTQFALQLRGDSSKTLEVNCAGADHPPLRAFDPRVHNLVLFDECSPSLVLRYRRLFQAPNTRVIIGSSPTNRDAYGVYLHDCAIVVASNTWEEELKALNAENQNWLQSNMVFLNIKKPLWKGQKQ